MIEITGGTAGLLMMLAVLIVMLITLVFDRKKQEDAQKRFEEDFYG
ncbi:hypothetical protein Acj9p218 [Acinetobacter phage Acj9]|uniref:Uncharacterized protein n=1 Tax=Acinetobacter phage Acj9 TaxID=760939 RepID=E5EQ02_9CAUD|nr:hypothetical protein Acj9p218 [Acinetobacter phage Acj9]ADG60118.1 hypothetical protein Acj9p218 [Acinetobacter phage Acj9]